jgi:hypothetical protein
LYYFLGISNNLKNFWKWRNKKKKENKEKKC